MKKGIGVPFEKGKSGNPGGRPVMQLYKNGKLVPRENLKIYLQRYGHKAAKRLVELVGSDDEKIALGAVKLLLDRAYGKETTNIQIEGEVSHTFADVLDEVAKRLKAKKLPTLKQIDDVVDAEIVDVTPLTDSTTKRRSK